MSTLLPPSSAQELLIETNLDTLLLQFMLFGVYSVVYFGTIYLYSTRASSQRRMVIAAISASYFFSVVITNLQWCMVKRSFIDNGATQDTTLVIMRPDPSWYNLANYICFFIVGIIADGLLIWRCFYVWNRSLIAILLPLLFLFGTIVYLSMLVVTCLDLNFPASQDSQIPSTLIGVTLFLDLASTLAATGLICYRINPFAKQGTFHCSRFKHIVEILVQSAAAYSLVTIAFAVVSLIPTELESVNAAQLYTAVFYLFSAGIAPTIMVARVLTTAGKRGETLEIAHAATNLQFHHTSTTVYPVQYGQDSNHVENRD